MPHNTFLMAYSLELATGVKSNLWEECSKGDVDLLIESMNDHPIAWAYYNYFMDLAILQHLTEGEV